MTSDIWLVVLFVLMGATTGVLIGMVLHLKDELRYERMASKYGRELAKFDIRHINELTDANNRLSARCERYRRYMYKAIANWAIAQHHIWLHLDRGSGNWWKVHERCVDHGRES